MTTRRQTVVLQVRDVSDLQDLLRTHELDVDCGGPRRLADGGVAITAFLTPSQLVDLRREQHVELTEIDIPRMREGVDVGQGDRYNGGRNHPSGYGRKVRDEDDS